MFYLFDVLISIAQPQSALFKTIMNSERFISLMPHKHIQIERFMCVHEWDEPFHSQIKCEIIEIFH